MFSTERWALLVEQTYGYQSGFIDNTEPPVYYSSIENEVDRYLVTPAFGDFCWLSASQLLALSSFVSKYPDSVMRLKVCSEYPPDSTNFRTKTAGYVHQINFGSYDEWNDSLIKCKFRNQVNQGRKSGLDARFSREKKDVLEFWEMHANLRMKKFGEVPQPREFFLNLHRIYLINNRGFLINAYDSNSNLVAGIIVLVEGDTAYYKFAASKLSALSMRPNNFLLDYLIAHLSELGIGKLNLGYTGSSLSYSGLRKYKLSAGANEYPRYSVTTRNFNSVNSGHIESINRQVSTLIKENPDLDEIDAFSGRYYKFFV